MANDESNAGPQEQFPDLYKLLGLSPLESDIAKIQRAVTEMQRKADASQKTDIKLAQRAAKVVALCKKNLLDVERKPIYDRAWTKSFGAVSTPEPVPGPVHGPVHGPTPVRTAEAKAPELEWDLDELEAYLPAEDPRSAFDLGGFLRYSASQPESNPLADYEKLQSFLGGTATATIAAPESISASVLMPEYGVERERQYDDREPALDNDAFIKPKPPSLPQRVPPGGFAKQIRKKRNRAVLLSVGGVFGSLALVGGAFTVWLNSNKPATKDATELAQATRPEKVKKDLPNDLNAPNVPAVPQGSGLPKVAGLGGETAPDMTAEKPVEKPVENSVPMQAAPAMSPATMPPETTPATTPPTTTPDTTPATPPTTSTTTPPPTTTEPTPPATPAPTADPVLTDAEKSKWSKTMKELLKTLGNQDFAAAKKQLAESEALARTQLQKDQYKRIATVATLSEEYHGFLVDAINGLGAAETFKIGGSSEAAFIEGNDVGVVLKIRGKIQTFKLTELQIGVANGLVDLKMDTAHPKSLARKAAFVLVHPKTNDLALKRAREQMAEAAGSGAVDADMATVFDEDYSLKKG